MNEKMSLKVMALLPHAITDAMLLVKPFHYSTYWIYALVGILSALLAAGAATSICFLSKIAINKTINF